MTEKKFGIGIGAMALPLAKQVRSQGIRLVLDSKARDLFQGLQEDVYALNRLYLRGVLPDGPTIRARKKLIKVILAFVKKHGVIT